MTKENWREVVGYEGVYEVSDQGRVKRVGRAARNGKGRGGGARIGRILKPQPNRGGHLSVHLWKNGVMRRFLVHKLVARAFIGPVPPGKEVNHDDGVKRNNGVLNLEYMTRGQNLAHAYRTGLRVATVPTGESHHNAKLTRAKAADIRRRYVPRVCTLKMLAREYGVDHKTIHRVISGKTWSKGET